MSKPYIIENVSLQIEGTQSKIEEMEDFHKSYYGKEFFQAFQVVAEILKQNEKIFERYREDGYENAVKLTQSQIHNIVPFIGKRGTGKTSAMVSFAGALKDYYKKYGENKEDIFFAFSKSNDISFTCLDCIDSSLLENGEDIFKVILAQMYGDFLRINRENLEKRDDDQRRKIQKKFDKVYKSICQLEVKTPREDYWEESPIMSLKSLSSSLSIKMDFEELIQDYLKVVDKHRKAQNHFLVIVIDDLDLNIDSGFDMLEKIHRYMMIPNVIILLAIDYDQLKLLCEKHFYKIVPFVEEKIKEKSQEVENLAKDFLDKALPCHMRIYMPNLAKCQGIAVKEKENELDLKTAVFQEIYEKLGMRMDVKGEKRHFFEQNSLRSYVNFYLMLKTMNELNDQNLVIEGDNKEFFSIYERNYKLLMSDITTRMLDERLNSNSKKAFFKITESKLPRSCRNLFSHINKIIDDMKIKEKTQLNSLEKNLKSLADIVDEYEYSYGEIMRIIYCWGRCDEQSKEIIRCLLAFYSLEMTRLYYYYRYDSKENGNKENRTKIFREILNGSFAGSWANKMMPLMRKEGTERFFNVGDRQKVMMEQVFQIQLSPEMKRKIAIWKEESGSNKEEQKKYIKKIFRSVLVLGMFFDQPYYKKQEQFRWDIQQTKKSGNSSKLKDDFLANTQREDIIKNKEGIGNFNIMNFVSNAFQYKENIIPLMNSLYKCLFGDESNEKLKELEIEQEFESWANYCGAFALPIYDMDVSYNLLKRVRQRMYGQSINARTEKEILKETIDIYNFMSEQLKENDEKYETGMVHWEKWQYKEENYSGYKISMKDAFEYCPYIKWITNRNEYLVNEFDDWFASILKELTVRGSSECKEDEKTKENEIRWMGYDD